ncbi:MAG TPA: type II CAAX endopeptidase family protein [Vicinamibacterales bacterium]|nr:type II CAAX endopeptidase family protein [Vicinamibacterales bacterium]
MAPDLAAAIPLFAFAVIFFLVDARSREARLATPAGIAGLLAFAATTAAILSLSVAAWRDRLRASRAPDTLKLLAGPLALLLFVVSYAAAAGLPIAERAITFSAFLLAPAVVLLATRRRPPAQSREPAPRNVLVAAALLWLPIEFRLLPALPQPPPDGFNGVPLVALASGLYLFLVARPLDGIGYTFRLTRRDFATALLATAAFAPVAIPIGLATGFLEWRPQVTATTLLAAPLAIYLATGIPEEFLFRGLIQNATVRWMGGAAGFILASVIFGLAHLPDWRYVALASPAGAAYGWVYAKTGKITAAAVTHAAVDWLWILLLRA